MTINNVQNTYQAEIFTTSDDYTMTQDETYDEIYKEYCQTTNNVQNTYQAESFTISDDYTMTQDETYAEIYKEHCVQKKNFDTDCEENAEYTSNFANSDSKINGKALFFEPSELLENDNPNIHDKYPFLDIENNKLERSVDSIVNPIKNGKPAQSKRRSNFSIKKILHLGQTAQKKTLQNDNAQIKSNRKNCIKRKKISQNLEHIKKVNKPLLIPAIPLKFIIDSLTSIFETENYVKSLICIFNTQKNCKECFFKYHLKFISNKGNENNNLDFSTINQDLKYTDGYFFAKNNRKKISIENEVANLRVEDTPLYYILKFEVLIYINSCLDVYINTSIFTKILKQFRAKNKKYHSLILDFMSCASYNEIREHTLFAINLKSKEHDMLIYKKILCRNEKAEKIDNNTSSPETATCNNHIEISKNTESKIQFGVFNGEDQPFFVLLGNFIEEKEEQIILEFSDNENYTETLDEFKYENILCSCITLKFKTNIDKQYVKNNINRSKFLFTNFEYDYKTLLPQIFGKYFAIKGLNFMEICQILYNLNATLSISKEDYYNFVNNFFDSIFLDVNLNIYLFLPHFELLYWFKQRLKLQIKNIDSKDFFNYVSYLHIFQYIMTFDWTKYFISIRKSMQGPEKLNNNQKTNLENMSYMENLKYFYKLKFFLNTLSVHIIQPLLSKYELNLYINMITYEKILILKYFKGKNLFNYPKSRNHKYSMFFLHTKLYFINIYFLQCFKMIIKNQICNLKQKCIISENDGTTIHSKIAPFLMSKFSLFTLKNLKFFKFNKTFIVHLNGMGFAPIYMNMCYFYLKHRYVVFADNCDINLLLKMLSRISMDINTEINSKSFITNILKFNSTDLVNDCILALELNDIFYGVFNDSNGFSAKNNDKRGDSDCQDLCET
ncbi:hypothetical protein COBT_001272 [Conglomerata obtusa]